MGSWGMHNWRHCRSPSRSAGIDRLAVHYALADIHLQETPYRTISKVTVNTSRASPGLSAMKRVHREIYTISAIFFAVVLLQIQSYPKPMTLLVVALFPSIHVISDLLKSNLY